MSNSYYALDFIRHERIMLDQETRSTGNGGRCKYVQSWIMLQKRKNGLQLYCNIQMVAVDLCPSFWHLYRDHQIYWVGLSNDWRPLATLNQEISQIRLAYKAVHSPLFTAGNLLKWLRRWKEGRYLTTAAGTL